MRLFCQVGFVPERLATPLAFSLSSTWHFFFAILWRMEAFSRNFPEKEAPQRLNQETSAGSWLPPVGAPPRATCRGQSRR